MKLVKKKTVLPSATSHESAFREVVALIEKARHQALRTVNTALIDLYWQVGKYITRKLERAAWGEGVVEQLARYIARHHPDIKGFTRRNLFRMRQFYGTYRNHKKVSPLVTQLPWTHNLLILSKCKRSEEREFYLRLAIRENWNSRELERQMNGALFQRTILSPTKVSATLTQLLPGAETIFKDTYLLDFLDLPEDHSESDLQEGLVSNLKKLLLELGRDFIFVGEQYLLQVGGKDFFHDLSFDALQQKHSFTNFVALHAAWQKTLDSSELNKRFFREIRGFQSRRVRQCGRTDELVYDFFSSRPLASRCS
ncbi:MAG: DUF1016 domain-containing protein [Planctomycetes bacterium]|nr:DUF1016 domain-containing protein [Planctomycetota bacterium]